MNVRKHHYILLALVLAVIFLRTAVSNVYPIILPYLRTYFVTSRQIVELSIPLFFAGLGVSQLFYGPLSDRFGRKKILLLGETIFLFGFVGGFFSKTIIIFIIFCVMQGVGAGCAFSITAAILRDVYVEKETLAKRFSLMEASYGAALVLAPLLGGYIQEYLGWADVFAIIITSTLALIFLLYFFLDETNKNVLQFRFKTLVKNYMQMSQDKIFLCLLVLLTLSTAFSIFFNEVSPFLSLRYFNLRPIQYGGFLMLVGVFYISGVIFNIYLSKIISLYKTIICGLLMCFFVYLGMFFAIHFRYINVYTLFLPRCLALFAWGLIFPNVKTLAMTCYPKSLGGTCGAYIGFVIYCASSIITSFFAELDVRTLENFVYINIFLSLIGFLIYVIIYKKIKDRRSDDIQISSKVEKKAIS